MNCVELEESRISAWTHIDRELDKQAERWYRIKRALIDQTWNNLSNKLMTITFKYNPNNKISIY